MDYIKLSKEVSYALRHAPWEYELELDEDGWVDTTQILESLRVNLDWSLIKEADLIHMIEISDKRRHEISNGRIRAFYGHSIPNKIIKVQIEPPEFLFHGTSRAFVSSIRDSGLIPKGRQYIHLSTDITTASQVGKRRDNTPVILKINSKNAFQEGVKFYHGNDKVWLADFLPSNYIDFEYQV
jgi:putative RNA 2'-phosphotransferase